MSALKEIIARFGISLDTKPLEKGDKMIHKVIGGLKALAPAIGATALVAGFSSFADSVDKLAKQARALNMPIEELQAWRRAANRAGLETAVLETGLSKIQKKAFDAEQGGGALAKAFKRLNVEAKNADGSFKGGAQLFEEVGAGLAGLEDSTERTALAMLLFEEQGAKFLNLFGQSPEAIKATLAEMKGLGVVTEEYANDVEAMNDAFGDVKLGFVGLAVAITGTLVPALTWIAERLEGTTIWFRGVAENTNLLQSAVTVLSLVLGSRLLVALGRWIAMNRALLVSQLRAIAPLALAVLLVDELITTWQGGDTLIRRAIDGIFGEGTTAQIVDWMKGVLHHNVDFLSNWSTRWGEFWGFLKADIDRALVAFDEWTSAVGADFQYLIDGIAGWFSGLWGSITSGASNALAEVKNAIASLPGAEAIFGIKATASAPSAGSRNQTNNVSQSNTVTVNMQGGGSPADGRRIAGAVRTAITPSLRPALSSLAPGF